jgi:isoleucyl-tRNA synthetase
MSLVREVASLGRSARMNNKLKVRQPLSLVEVILADETHLDYLESNATLIATELNVKQVAFTTQTEKYISYQIQPNFKLLGPMLGKDLPAVKKWLNSADGNELSGQLATEGKIRVTLDDGRVVELNDEHVQRRLVAKEGWAAAEGKQCVVVLSTELTGSLIREGLARDLVRYIQDRRKELDCEYTARICVGLVAASTDVRAAVDEFGDYVRQETLAEEIIFEALAGVESTEVKVGDDVSQLYVAVV